MADFETIILSMYKDTGRAWLEALPDLIKNHSKTFELEDLRPVQNLSYNYVLTGLQAGWPIVLKLSLDEDGLRREAAALKIFQGYGGVGVLGEAPWALLLSRAVPGTSLKSFYPSRDHEALRIACKVMHHLHQAPVPASGFPHIEDWLKTLDGDWDIPSSILIKARALRDQLLLKPYRPVLLHGDLHHENILQDGDGWVAIDPKGVMGQPVHEVWALIGNPTPYLSKDQIKDRLGVITKQMDLDLNQTTAWCFVQSVLSWIWDLEDNLNPRTIGLTEIFDNLVVVKA